MIDGWRGGGVVYLNQLLNCATTHAAHAYATTATHNMLPAAAAIKSALQGVSAAPRKCQPLLPRLLLPQHFAEQQVGAARITTDKSISKYRHYMCVRVRVCEFVEDQVA